FFSCTGGHRDLHNNRHSFPTRRSSDLTKLDPDAAKKSTPAWAATARASIVRSEEHTSELQSPAVISYAVFCLKKKNPERPRHHPHGRQLPTGRERTARTD